mmetsp:Transcript_94418/g.281807  ORF Transcript_94418/g.281807 Transcript_94418/m.281807 type:complete len:415 (-) Transcript_94418:19-1263(-)|eukprot:CAMPEP_0175211398 /NCGR_PEP_ID=MMETSP0093-20121207/15138_1 /TAXON_ID=311494 /ORGANISM="Alexandrium monilatum, Strain CCMP3105" /LENGTH=414 /DNA_ID=CAMNT_0016504653 /DNA_START=23 /DNA_END=1267 /DNA_ORIENTATION=+
MVQPKGTAFAVGDVVKLKDMPGGTGFNGASATLVKALGKDRWVAQIEGQERGRVVSTANLEHGESQKKQLSRGHFIVGTWDDWDPHEMTWSAEYSCFTYEVALGGEEQSFKFLLGGDWDSCVYPDHGNAAPFDGHKIHGPDAGGLDTEWTIRRHQEDDVNVRYVVCMFATADGHVERVDWEPLGRIGERQTSPSSRQQLVRRMKPVERPEKPEEPPDEGMVRPSSPFFFPVTQRPNDSEVADVVEFERQARIRLERRLREAAEAEFQAIEDQKESDAQAQAAEARREMRASFQQLSRWRTRALQQQETERNREVANGRCTPCTECGKQAETCINQEWVCKLCRDAWVKAQKAGWDGALVCGEGYRAAEWLQWIGEQERLLPRDARLQVIEAFPHVFAERAREKAHSKRELVGEE